MQPPEKKPVILAIDIGTSSVRAAIYDHNAKPVRGMSSKIGYSFTRTADGGFETGADALLANVVAAIDDVLEKTEKVSGEIECVASCAFWHSLVGVDAKGRPTTPVFGWADTRSRKYTEVLRERFDERDRYERTGARFHSSFWPAKLLWLRKESAKTWAKTAKWLSFSDYVSLKLCDETVTSVSMASATGIFDQRECDWDAELVRYLKITRKQLAAITDRSFRLSSKFSKRWPRLKNAVWFPAIGDGAADNIGCGCTQKTLAALMIGTSCAMRVAYRGKNPKRIPDGLWCYRVDRGRAIIGGALSDGGNLYQQLQGSLEIPKNAENKMRRRGAAAHGLTVMPFFHGERSTGYNENARGAILGLTPSHDAIDILQAAMEAVAYRFAEILDRLERVTPINEIVASGGALRDSPVWTQIIADVLGRDLLINNTRESSMRGAVLLALESLGKIENLDRSPGYEVLPFHTKCHEAYKKARKRHNACYRQLIGRVPSPI